MNIVNRLTLRTLKKNKRRTLVTILGVIISVAMITAVSTLVVSFLDLLQRQEVADNGEWHVLYPNVNKEQIDGIKQDEATEKVILSRDVGYAYLDGGQNVDKPYLFVKAYDSAGFQNFPIHLVEGRLPTSSDEVIISKHIADNGGVHLHVGDTLNLEVGKRVVPGQADQIEFNQDFSLNTVDGENIENLENATDETYKIVGIMERPSWEPTWAPGYTVLSFLDESLLTDTETVNASVILNKVNRSVYDHAADLSKNLKIDNVQFNNRLLRYYGVIRDDNQNQVLYSFSAILMVIIFIGSVSLIYNAFAISVSERSRYLGMLASVGATKRQKRNSVFFEGAVIGLISIPVGIITGFIGISITFHFINSSLQGALGVSETLKAVASPLSIFVAIFISAVTIFISTYLPALKASRITAIDAIRQTADIKLTRKAVKTAKPIRKIFGIEAEIGLKNLKRNKRRYHATIFSLVISIVLFLSVSYFTQNLQKSYEVTQFGPNYDMRILFNGLYEKEAERAFQEISKFEDVTEATYMQDVELNAPVENDLLTDEVREMINMDPSYLENGKFPYVIHLHVLNEDSLKSYADQIHINYEKLTVADKRPAIVVNVNQYQDYKKKQYVKVKAIEAEIGETLDLQYEDWENGKKQPVGKVEIAALTDQLPMGAPQETSPGELHVIISREVFSQLSNEKNMDNSYFTLYLNSTDPLKTEQEIDKLEFPNQPSIYNVYQQRQQDEQMVAILRVFVYGFVSLITAIAVANIFNTISTSIALRKREFAMLKSIGMTPKGFNKMINYESIFYGFNALLYGFPISIGMMLLMFRSLQSSFVYRFELPWVSLCIVIIGVFVIVGSTMLYSSSKLKKENIIESLRQENI